MNRDSPDLHASLTAAYHGRLNAAFEVAPENWTVR